MANLAKRSDMSDAVREVTEALKGATPGPWKHFKAPSLRASFGRSAPINEIQAARKQVLVKWTGFDAADTKSKKTRANARAIVACVNHAPALLARIAELEAALKPFAQFAELDGDTDLPDDPPVEMVIGFTRHNDKITVGDLRRARNLTFVDYVKSALAAPGEG